jgi:ATP-dependent helicase HrpB
VEVRVSRKKAQRTQKGLDVSCFFAAQNLCATVVVHILAPGMKPVQITQNLAGFWREHYPRIKSELQRKYPKHLWR